MKLASKVFATGALLLFLPVSAALAQAPILSNIPNVTLNVGATTVVNVVAVDPNGDAITLSASGASFATLNAPTTGTGVVATTLLLAPTVGASGTYTITVTATANGQTDTETFDVAVNAAGNNQAPVVVSPTLRIVNEGENVNFVVTAADANLEAIAFLSASGLPTGATFTTNTANTSGTFNWTPNATQSGHYDVTFTAANGLEGAASTHIQVMDVTGGNHLPTLSLPATLSVNEGAQATFTVTASDADADHVTLTATGVPSGATFVDNGNNTATFTWTPSSSQSGVYTVVVTGNDAHGGIVTSSSVVTVLDVGGANTPPVLSVPATLSVNEGAAVSFTLTATDVNGDHVTLTASGLPAGATFTDNGNNTASFAWTPSASQSGSHTVTFTGNDGHGGVTTATTVFTVIDVGGGGNHLPSVSAPSTRTVSEGSTLSFQVTATDSDGDHVTLSASGLPSGATFTDNGNNRGTFSWTPSSSQSGTYSVTFSGNDGHGGIDVTTTVITVLDVGGGGGGDATATVIGKIKGKKKQVCFRIVPVNNAFDLRAVNLASITLDFNGSSIAAISKKSHIAFDCEDDDGDHDGGDDHDGCRDCWGDRDRDDDHDGDRDRRHDGGSWGDDDDDGDDECTVDTGDCVATHARVCFSTREIRNLLGSSDIRTLLMNATISGDLTTGGSFVATIGVRVSHGNGHGDDNHGGNGGGHGMNCKASPNPLNPTTKFSFTLSQPGRVRVLIYDVKGRLVKTLLDESRTVGDHSLLWDGSDSRKSKVGSGVYFFKVIAPQGAEVQRVTVLK